MEEGGRG